jgi:hypothetical protein
MTSRKSARFRVRRCFSPYLDHYSRAFAFSAFLYPLRQLHSLRFACRRRQRNGLTLFRMNFSSGADPSCAPVASISMMVQRTNDHALPLTFWFKPVSTFGLSDVTAPKDVHVCWSYPPIPCSSPPSCWQIPPRLTARRTGYPAVTLSPKLHTEPLPAPQVRVGTADGTAGFI